MQYVDAEVDRHRDLLGKNHERQQVRQQERSVMSNRPDFVARMRLRAGPLGRLGRRRRDEIIPVAPGLHREEHAVQPDRHENEEGGLERRERRTGRGYGHIRQDQAEHGQRYDHGQEGVGTLEVVRLFVVP